MLLIRSILHPTDFSEASMRASEFAFGLAKDYRARLILLHVIDPTAYDVDLNAPLPNPEVLRRNAETALEELLPIHDGVHVQRIVTVGAPASEILNEAAEWNVDLIVLGTHGRVGLSRLLMGSIAEEVLRRASCPVVALTPATANKKPNTKTDWISAAMANPECAADRAERDNRVERVTCQANASFSATVEHTVRTSNRWLRDVRVSLSEENQSRSFRILRAVLHTLRDHLTVHQVASLGAQLPLLFRGIWYAGWNPSGKPIKRRRKADFVAHVMSQLNNEPVADPQSAIRGVLGALSKHLTPGEVDNIERALPLELRELWPHQAEFSSTCP